MQETRNDTAWEQGCVLSASSAAKLGLLVSDADGAIAILISHDCDVLESAAVEPMCEILIGRKIGSVDGHYTNGKSPRRLHLTFSAGAASMAGDFLATDKKTIKKELLLAETPQQDVRLTQDEHFTLQSWLSSRYHRSIFPDEFDRRLKERPAETHKKIANAIKGTGTDLLAVLFDIDTGKAVVHEGPDDPYALSILLVYNVSEDPVRAAATATKAASLIKSLFRQYYFRDRKWRNIELRECIAVSADAISLYQLRTTKPWHFDYLEVVTAD
ncbi:hypothetical protein XI06_24645 [Bradyrhizobium sp. CCBAU 11434]|uniref:hypothetical protein n=1 Tax=Bradyrhizobium sp. CCBAU 11434 TaxID=1630885 RepID=UPI002305EE8F|nr:hypothetical protein [Bradyrhizobium sp. CCBAU 11434]MDA9523383.1 hypothetical protein [Bradyrhizobium sp. CCBAU 11434]